MYIIEKVLDCFHRIGHNYVLLEATVTDRSMCNRSPMQYEMYCDTVNCT